MGGLHGAEDAVLVRRCIHKLPHAGSRIAADEEVVAHLQQEGVVSGPLPRPENGIPEALGFGLLDEADVPSQLGRQRFEGGPRFRRDHQCDPFHPGFPQFRDLKCEDAREPAIGSGQLLQRKRAVRRPCHGDDRLVEFH